MSPEGEQGARALGRCSPEEEELPSEGRGQVGSGTASRIKVGVPRRVTTGVCRGTGMAADEGLMQGVAGGESAWLAGQNWEENSKPFSRV